MGSFSNQTGLEIWKNLVFKVHYSFAAYFLPILTLFSLVCNALVCLIMVKSRGVKARIWKHIRIFYICFAIEDINIVIPFYLLRFLGMISKILQTFV